ncbi:sulfur carrier protein ThiS [Roseibium sediminis]|uniref:sulfur carrier protein ThiS n=1 Tax=Roseibium sediminis TaxID=1775174 RepID=UPI00123C7BA0|nr:sulfur carrier protein ThiS [Roseibium sediminis]
MKLIVNGEEQTVRAETLIDLLAELEFEGEWLATAVNNDLVAAEERVGFRLTDGDRIEVLAPMQGG